MKKSFVTEMVNCNQILTRLIHGYIQIMNKIINKEEFYEELKNFANPEKEKRKNEDEQLKLNKNIIDIEFKFLGKNEFNEIYIKSYPGAHCCKKHM